MKKIFLLFILCLPLSFSIASQKFWEEIRKGNSEQFKNQTINISGEISYVKKHIRSRDNFFIFHIKDPSSENFIEVKLYTLKKLKRINTFECKMGQRFFLTDKIKIQIKKNKIGKVLIEKTNNTLECFTVKTIEMPK